MNFNGGVYQNQNGLDPTAFNAPQAGTQGQYNPLELLMQLFKHKQANPSMGQSMLPYAQQPQAGVNYPDFNKNMPSMMQGLLD